MFNIETVRGSKRDSNGTFVSPNSSRKVYFFESKIIYSKHLHDIRVKDSKKCFLHHQVVSSIKINHAKSFS